jgi:hypothetical protein
VFLLFVPDKMCYLVQFLSGKHHLCGVIANTDEEMTPMYDDLQEDIT